MAETTQLAMDPATHDQTTITNLVRKSLFECIPRTRKVNRSHGGLKKPMLGIVSHERAQMERTGDPDVEVNNQLLPRAMISNDIHT
ncbi:hypothetical protein LTS12_028915, partial [Elasticomyces elasticus]